MKKKYQKEARKRLKCLGIPREITECLKEDFEILVTDFSGEVGKLEKVHLKALEAFDLFGVEGYPFYVIENFMYDYPLISILFVEENEEKWKADRLIAKDGSHIAFTYNLKNAELSEVEFVELEVVEGTLLRVG